MCWRISASVTGGSTCRYWSKVTRRPGSQCACSRCAPGVTSAGNPVDRCWLGRAGCHADPHDGLLAAVIVDHDVTGLYQRQQGVAGCRHASACCRWSLEVYSNVIAAGYLHPYVLAYFVLPPVTRRHYGGLGDGRRERLCQAGCIAYLKARNINTEPDALGGITTLSRVRRLRDLGLCCTESASQGIRIRLKREPHRRLDQPSLCLWHVQVLGVSRVHQRVDQNRIELAQPGQQDCQHPVVVRVPWRPSARHAAAAFHDESKMTAIGLDEVFGIHDAAMVINQLHESEAPTYRWVMSRTTPRTTSCLEGRFAQRVGLPVRS